MFIFYPLDDDPASPPSVGTLFDRTARSYHFFATTEQDRSGVAGVSGAAEGQEKVPADVRSSS